MVSYIRIRLGFLFAAVVTGMLGIARDDARLVYAGIGLGLIGLALRALKPKKEKGP
jgi:hypothetical protein